MIIHLYNLFTQTDNEINGFKKDKHMSLQDFPLDLAYLGASFSLLFYRLFPSSSIDPVANIYFFFNWATFSPLFFLTWDWYYSALFLKEA